ncbi:MAG: hypothetical protein LBH03_00025 [Holophagales bacterium]|jgi:hypothetical protein|nr:hypothetical protein [Holophagales bacterium]
MITLVLTLLLQAQSQELVGPPQPSVYRWKDSAGKLRVTTTAPPVNATVIEVLTHNSTVEAMVIKEEVIPVTLEKLRSQMESTMEKETINYWHSIDKLFYAAKQSGNNAESLKTIDAILKKTLWGDGLWAISLLPLVIMAISLLIAWWVCTGLQKPAKTLVWAGFAFAGLLFSHIAMNSAIYRPQAKRLDFMLSMVPNYLGGYIQVKPDNQQAIRSHVEALPKTITPLSPAWIFPMEIYHIRQTLQRVVLDP